METSEGIFGNVEIPEWNTPKVDDLIALLDRVDVYKVLICGRDHNLPTIKEDRERFSSKEEIEKVVNDVIHSNGLGDSLYYSVAEGWLYQIMSRNATKWKGVQLVLKTEGISSDEAVYFGDDNDDFDSISNCGLGIAMGNAIERIKAAADRVAPSNEEDGVAVIIETLR